MSSSLVCLVSACNEFLSLSSGYENIEDVRQVMSDSDPQTSHLESINEVSTGAMSTLSSGSQSIMS